MRSVGRGDGLGVGTWLLILVSILILAGAVALTIYGGSFRPVQHEVEQVVANDKFPS